MNSNKQGINNNCYRATNFDKKKKKKKPTNVNVLKTFILTIYTSSRYNNSA